MKRIGTAAAVAAAGLVGLLGAATPVTAAESTIAGAPATRSLYVYEHDDFGGRSARLTANDGNFINNTWGGGSGGNINDNISSFRNTGSNRALLYTHADYGGTYYTALGHSEDKDLSNNSNNPSNFDNRASSVRFVS
ncbi:peptidase inhibitor family I36 protein [Marinactinospora thermotolerans]|uniref:Beta/gamma crystallin 'Greek key' domain-containing protein n=1 Tax=Marinactinospora thermotolerans DSM 45154 TaxID=1122192 RepID=A0A1T4QFL1_9ACTN|nr:peptidase inhibitor family I36 protein [Marinactinospora thermotolerans]SKA02281.1 hypothetical protein SAMN02745673_02196 [Marinactinospora thermotolerans DSM 45154]